MTLIRKNDGEIYILSPYECIWNEDAYYLIGYSDKHGKIITPRLDRIQDVKELVTDAHTMPDAEELLIYTNRTIKMYDGELRDVELICDNDLMIHLIDRFVASCNYCGDYLQVTHGDGKSNVICHCCGKNMVVIVKKGRVTVFEEGPTDNDPEYNRQIQYINIATRIKDRYISCNASS